MTTVVISSKVIIIGIFIGYKVTPSQLTITSPSGSLLFDSSKSTPGQFQIKRIGFEYSLS